MLDVIWLKAIAKALVLPPTGPLLLALLGLVLLRRFPRVGTAVATAGIAILLAISMPIVADRLESAVAVQRPFRVADAGGVKAIVVLAGGIRRDASDYGGDTLGSFTLERVRYGARVARLTGLPVLVSGGVVFGGEPEASVMRKSLENEFGVPVRWVESESRTTHENAVRSADLLRREGIDRVVLVTHDVDMRRAMAEFAAQGIDAIPAPTGMHGPLGKSLIDYLPSMLGFERSYAAIYEILANVVRIASGG